MRQKYISSIMVIQLILTLGGCTSQAERLKIINTPAYIIKGKRTKQDTIECIGESLQGDTRLPAFDVSINRDISGLKVVMEFGGAWNHQTLIESTINVSKKGEGSEITVYMEQNLAPPIIRPIVSEAVSKCAENPRG